MQQQWAVSATVAVGLLIRGTTQMTQQRAGQLPPCTLDPELRPNSLPLRAIPRCLQKCCCGPGCIPLTPTGLLLALQSTKRNVDLSLEEHEEHSISLCDEAGKGFVLAVQLRHTSSTASFQKCLHALGHSYCQTAMEGCISSSPDTFSAQASCQ